MKDIFEFLNKKVRVLCNSDKVFEGVVIGMASCFEEDTDDDGFDSIDVYDGGLCTQLFRNEIKEIQEIN